MRVTVPFRGHCRSSQLVLAAVLAGMILIGAGSSAVAAAKPNAASLKAAAAAASKAVLAGDASAGYGYLSAQCQKTTSQAKFSASMIFGTAFADSLGKVKLKDLRVGRVETRAMMKTRGQARVFIVSKEGSTALSDDPSWDIWVFERGGWHTTDCGELGDSSDAKAKAQAEYLSTVDFSNAPTSVTVDEKLAKQLDVGSGFTGSYTVDLLTTRDFGTTLSQPADRFGFGAATATAKGHFVGVNYKLHNGTNGPLSPYEAFGSLVSLTDGKATWEPTDDFRAESIVEKITGAPSPDSDVGAGFDASVWVVFDIPTTVTPTGLVMKYDSNSPVMLKLPPA